MTKNQIFNFIDTPNFVCQVEPDFSHPHAPLIQIRLSSADALVAFSFFALPRQLQELSRLFAVDAVEIEAKWKKIWEKERKKAAQRAEKRRPQTK